MNPKTLRNVVYGTAITAGLTAAGWVGSYFSTENERDLSSMTYHIAGKYLPALVSGTMGQRMQDDGNFYAIGSRSNNIHTPLAARAIILRSLFGRYVESQIEREFKGAESCANHAALLADQKNSLAERDSYGASRLDLLVFNIKVTEDHISVASNLSTAINSSKRETEKRAREVRRLISDSFADETQERINGFLERFKKADPNRDGKLDDKTAAEEFVRRYLERQDICGDK